MVGYIMSMSPVRIFMRRLLLSCTAQSRCAPQRVSTALRSIRLASDLSTSSIERTSALPGFPKLLATHPVRAIQSP